MLHTTKAYLPAVPTMTSWVFVGVLFACGTAAAFMWLSPAGPLPIVPRYAVESNQDGHVRCGPSEDLVASARGCADADPAADAKAALASGDRRLLGIVVRGPLIPETEESRFQHYEREFGVRYLYEGCVVSSEAESDYRRAADGYMTRYNKVVLAAANP